MTRVQRTPRVLKHSACVAFGRGREGRCGRRGCHPGRRRGLPEPVFVLINDQSFTKTASLWGVANNRRHEHEQVVLLQRP
jgi:hypothetical protein